MAKPGPKPKIGPEERRKILNILRAGASMQDAADLVGIDRKTIYNAMLADDGLSTGVKQARKRGKIRQLKKITASKDWKAAAWYLERAYGREFGRKDSLQVRAKVDHDVRNDLSSLLKDEASIEAAMILSRRLALASRENGTNGHDIGDRISPN